MPKPAGFDSAGVLERRTGFRSSSSVASFPGAKPVEEIRRAAWLSSPMCTKCCTCSIFFCSGSRLCCRVVNVFPVLARAASKSLSHWPPSNHIIRCRNSRSPASPPRGGWCKRSRGSRSNNAQASMLEGESLEAPYEYFTSTNTSVSMRRY